jgi:hypothetical protein
MKPTNPLLPIVAAMTLETHADAYDGPWSETVSAVLEWEDRHGFTTEDLLNKYCHVTDDLIASLVRDAIVQLSDMDLATAQHIAKYRVHP